MAKENPRYQGVLLDQNDQPIPGTEFKDWKSRSMAVVCAVVSKTKDGQFQFLLERRGPGCPDFVGCWAMPCGYVGWDESLREAAARELYEEVGLQVNPQDLKFAGMNDNPKENRQNITARFVVEVPEEKLLKLLDNTFMDSLGRGGEKGEVSELSLVPYFFVKDNAKDFAFSHDEVIKEMIDNYGKIMAGEFYKDSLG